MDEIRLESIRLDHSITFDKWFDIARENNPEDIINKKYCRAAWNAALVVAVSKIYDSDNWDLTQKDFAEIVEDGLVEIDNMG